MAKTSATCGQKSMKTYAGNGMTMLNEKWVHSIQSIQGLTIAVGLCSISRTCWHRFMQYKYNPLPHRWIPLNGASIDFWLFASFRRPTIWLSWLKLRFLKTKLWMRTPCNVFDAAVICFCVSTLCVQFINERTGSIYLPSHGTNWFVSWYSCAIKCLHFFIIQVNNISLNCCFRLIPILANQVAFSISSTIEFLLIEYFYSKWILWYDAQVYAHQG